MHSALYFGQVRHRRFAPRAHAFEYRLFMAYLDLADLESVFRGRWLWSTSRPGLAWLRRADYLGDPQVSLGEAVRAHVEQETGKRPSGPIRMLTNLRYFGLSFNPVTFYYVFDAADTRVETIVAEVTNTPWNERHVYVLADETNEGSGAVRRHRLAKRFHVSPFMPMDIDYDWRFSAPRESLSVHMENYSQGAQVFDATLALERRTLSGSSLARALAFFPLMTAKVVGAIYWEALRLWAKRVPFYTHPTKLASPSRRKALEEGR